MDPATAQLGASLLGSVTGSGNAAPAPAKSEAGASYQTGGLTINKANADWTMLALIAGVALVGITYLKGKTKPRSTPRKRRRRSGNH